MGANVGMINHIGKTTRLTLTINVMNGGRNRIVLRNGGYLIGKVTPSFYQIMENLGAVGIERRSEGDVVLESNSTHEFVFDPLTQRDALKIGETGIAYVVETNGKWHFRNFECLKIYAMYKEILTPDATLESLNKKPVSYGIPGSAYITIK